MLLSASDLINKSVALYRENRQLFLRYMLWLFAPTAAILIVSTLATTPDIAPSLSISLNIVSFLVLIGGSIVSIWISLAFTRAVASRYEGQGTPGPREGLIAAQPLIAPFIFASLLSGLAILGGLLLFFIPGIIFSIWFSFILQTIALDGKRGIEGLSASKQLVRGRWWPVWWRLFVPGIAFGAVIVLAQGVVEFPFQLLMKNLPPASLAAISITVISGLLGTAASLFFTPLAATAPTILYLELKRMPLPSTASPPLPPPPPTA